jgi:hypothetical protein
LLTLWSIVIGVSMSVDKCIFSLYINDMLIFGLTPASNYAVCRVGAPVWDGLDVQGRHTAGSLLHLLEL